MKLIRPLSKTSQEAQRSAQVRERRSSASKARVHAAATHATNPVARRSIPVTPGFSSRPIMQRTASKARRKFSIALNSDGAQLVLPSLPIVHPGWQTLSAVLVALLLAFIIYMTSSDTFRVDTLTVNGAVRVQPADLLAALDISGDPVFSLNTTELTAKLHQDYPEFSAISLSVGLPNQVTLDVVERQPVFEWQYGDQTLWIDLDGAVFHQRGVATLAVTVVADVPPPMVMVDGAPIAVEEETEEEAALSALPAVKAIKPAESYDPAVRRADMDVLMAAATLTLRKPPESPLYYHESEGFGWQDSRGWQVYFGRELDDLELKLSMYQAIINQLAQQGIQPTLISVAHVHAPFYRALQTGSVEQ